VLETQGRALYNVLSLKLIFVVIIYNYCLSQAH